MLRYLYWFGWVVTGGLLSWTLAVFGTSGVLQWHCTRVVLGRISREEQGVIAKLLAISREGPGLKWKSTMLLYAGGSALLVGVAGREGWAVLAAAIPLTILFWVRVRTTTTPVVILLGTSTYTSVKRQKDVKKRIAPLRVVSLLKVSVPWDQELTDEMALDCFRTTNEDDWFEVVKSLMEHSLVVAIDAAAETSGVVREGQHILERGFMWKCMFLVPPDDRAPLLDVIVPELGERKNLRIVKYEDAPDAIARMVEEMKRRRRLLASGGLPPQLEGQHEGGGIVKLLDWITSRVEASKATPYYNEGTEYLHRGQYYQAIVSFTQAIQINPHHARSFNNRAVAYRHRGAFPEAIADYNQAMRLGQFKRKKAAACYYNRGITFHQCRKYDQAIADYSEAIRLNPKAAEYYANRGGAHFAKCEYDKTVSDCTEAIRLRPRDTTLYSNRANAYRAQGDLMQALSDDRRASQLGG